jgi:hypothetical protein
VADAFAGAEGAVNQDKMAALNTLATFGRQGMEQAVLNKQRASEAQTGLATANATQPYATTMNAGMKSGRQNLNQAQMDALANIGAAGAQAYRQDAADAATFLGSEQNMANKVNANFYGQVQQAVPGMRANAAQVADEYRAAYEQRQADFAAAQEEQALRRQEAALQLQIIQQEADQRRAAFLASPEGQAIAEALRAAGMSGGMPAGRRGVRPTAPRNAGMGFRL